MTRRGFVVLLLAGVMLTLTPLAHAAPPDQTWIAGLYDNADYDDVVLFVTSGAELVDKPSPHDPGLILTVIACVPLDDESCPAALAPAANSARAPPAA
jgi:predicted anti-sigma-YlaC factor YlaD